MKEMMKEMKVMRMKCRRIYQSRQCKLEGLRKLNRNMKRLKQEMSKWRMNSRWRMMSRWMMYSRQMKMMNLIKQQKECKMKQQVRQVRTLWILIYLRILRTLKNNKNNHKQNNRVSIIQWNQNVFQGMRGRDQSRN